MPVDPGSRDSSLHVLPWKVAAVILAAALSLTNYSLAQTQSTTAPSDPAAPTQTLNTSPEKPDPSAGPIAPGGSIPTASQVEAAGAAEAAKSPELNAAKPATEATPNGVSANQPNLQPMYNVSLIGQRNVGSGLDFYSLDREIALGRSLANEVESSAKQITQPNFTDYLNRI